MKLSEAIRLGATLKPQAFGEYYRDGGSCALGAAADAICMSLQVFRSPFGFFDPRYIPHEWSTVLRAIQAVSCPVDGCESYGAMRLPHLNDEHRWTRERIADFVELHEALPEPSVVSTELVEVQP